MSNRQGITVKGHRIYTVQDAHEAAGCQTGRNCDGRGCKLKRPATRNRLPYLRLNDDATGTVLVVDSCCDFGT